MATDPSTLTIVQFPADVLRKPAEPVAEVTDEVRAVAHRMIELMRRAEGIGLAAPQVGLPWRMFVAHVPASEDRSASSDPPTASSQPQVFINPRLSDYSRDLVPLEEGCLSLPGITGEVRRPSQVTITATDLGGNEFSQRGADLLARCWQHENDHLDGVLIIDKMSSGSRLKNRSAIRSLERGAATL